MNQTRSNQITDHIILSFASVSFSSLHLESNIFIPAIIIITIAINDIMISINQTISVLRVFHKLNASIKTFDSFPGVLNQEEYVVVPSDHHFVSNALNNAPGIFIKTNATTVYHNCLLADESCSSSVHILITI
jgi:hypothetical protein